MYCPFCSFEETKVIDSRLSGEGEQVRRRRECLRCGERFTTFESASDGGTAAGGLVTWTIGNLLPGERRSVCDCELSCL